MRRIQLRTVVAWMGLVILGASSLLGVVWKQHACARLSRALYHGDKERARLQSEVMLLETDVRALRQPARLETLGRERFGLVDPGPPVMVTLERAPAAYGGARGTDAAAGNVASARWGGGFAWRTSGW